ncbi:MAG: diaminopimelate decarboxylase [Lachnospiraceae bacterium]|nr:diaminopimelate decarboxylase [Lachnospiraceae bacterium]
MNISEEVLYNISQDYKTPAYVFDLDAFHSRFAYYKEIFGDDIAINYCMKTNPFLTVESLGQTDRIEVCSYGEFLICKSQNIPPERLLISGVLKKQEDVEEIMSYCTDKAVYTAESVAQVHIINDIASRDGYKVNLLFRLNCNQFGMDEDTIINVLNNIDNLPGISFYGIHYFTGTQKHKIRKHEKEIVKLDKFFARINTETGLEVENLEYGTGFGVPYFMGQDETVTDRETLIIFKALLESMNWHGRISLEMGRALAYDCGYYLTAIRDLKESDGKRYAIVDGGIHQINYDGQLRGMYQPHMHVIRDGCNITTNLLDTNYTYGIYGSLCTTNDVLVGAYDSVELQENDIIVFERTGAYSVYEGMSLFLSHELPAVIVYSQDAGIVCKRMNRESYELNM